MSTKLTIIEGNSNDKDNVRAIMVKGETGNDGVSPTITASKTEKTTTISITDVNGTTEADVIDGFNPTVTPSRSGNKTTLTITDIDGTRTTDIYDGVDLTGGIPTNGVIGWDNDDISYTCDGTETGDYYLTYESTDYYFTMPSVEDGDILLFNTIDLELSLNGTAITTASSGTGTELTFIEYIPNGFELTDETFQAEVIDSLDGNSTTNAPSVRAVNEGIENTKGQILWTNPNPTAEISSDTQITLSSGDYDYIKIFSRLSLINNYCFSMDVLKGYGTRLYFGASYRAIDRNNNTSFTIKPSSDGQGNVMIPQYIVGYKTRLFN